MPTIDRRAWRGHSGFLLARFNRDWVALKRSLEDRAISCPAPAAPLRAPLMLLMDYGDLVRSEARHATEQCRAVIAWRRRVVADAGDAGPPPFLGSWIF